MAQRIAHKVDDKPRTTDIQIHEDVSFYQMGLSEKVLDGLSASGFQRPSPVQLQAISQGRCGLDLVVHAKSGTGKTLVFVIIGLEMIDVEVSFPQILILAPTREIAVQIFDVFVAVGSQFKGLKVNTFIGGTSYKDDASKANNSHVAIATPGRLIHLIKSKKLDVEHVRLIVLDEADKLLEENYKEDINFVFDTLSINKQVIVTSATYPGNLQALLMLYMRNPITVTPGSNAVLVGIRQFATIVPERINKAAQVKLKCNKLIKILKEIPYKQAVVFMNYGVRGQAVCNQIKGMGLAATFIAGKQSTQSRLNTISQLKTYKCRILVTTDLIARGVDFENVNLVVNFDLPWDASTYWHRIGRAGRYGSHGIAISIISENELQSYREMLSSGGSDFSVYELSEVYPKDIWTTDNSFFQKIYPNTEEVPDIKTVNTKTNELQICSNSVPKCANTVSNIMSSFSVNNTPNQVPDNSMDKIENVPCVSSNGSEVAKTDRSIRTEKDHKDKANASLGTSNRNAKIKQVKSHEKKKMIGPITTEKHTVKLSSVLREIYEINDEPPELEKNKEKQPDKETCYATAKKQISHRFNINVSADECSELQNLNKKVEFDIELSDMEDDISKLNEEDVVVECPFEPCNITLSKKVCSESENSSSEESTVSSDCDISWETIYPVNIVSKDTESSLKQDVILTKRSTCNITDKSTDNCITDDLDNYLLQYLTNLDVQNKNHNTNNEDALLKNVSKWKRLIDFEISMLSDLLTDMKESVQRRIYHDHILSIQNFFIMQKLALLSVYPELRNEDEIDATYLYSSYSSQDNILEMYREIEDFKAEHRTSGPTLKSYFPYPIKEDSHMPNLMLLNSEIESYRNILQYLRSNPNPRKELLEIIDSIGFLSKPKRTNLIEMLNERENLSCDELRKLIKERKWDISKEQETFEIDLHHVKDTGSNDYSLANDLENTTSNENNHEENNILPEKNENEDNDKNKFLDQVLCDTKNESVASSLSEEESSNSNESDDNYPEHSTVYENEHTQGSNYVDNGSDFSSKEPSALLSSQRNISQSTLYSTTSSDSDVVTKEPKDMSSEKISTKFVKFRKRKTKECSDHSNFLKNTGRGHLLNESSSTPNANTDELQGDTVSECSMSSSNKSTTYNVYNDTTKCIHKNSQNVSADSLFYQTASLSSEKGHVEKCKERVSNSSLHTDYNHYRHKHCVNASVSSGFPSAGAKHKPQLQSVNSKVYRSQGNNYEYPPSYDRYYSYDQTPEYNSFTYYPCSSVPASDKVQSIHNRRTATIESDDSIEIFLSNLREETNRLHWEIYKSEMLSNWSGYQG